MILMAAGRGLIWQDWDDVYLVYQPSSTETHVFNETTAQILKCLEHGSLSTAAAKERTEAALGVGPGELSADDFAFATMRLEELGLVERLDDVSAAQ
ncbi:HPr-rel-A system PqqD family peptide chaperone [Accumulibacter sp.]|uniref:HPr-rel-A system PqqD family peptide chaperone n=1 Tax=Accumulibacter sp. TaxID=2053492 RepID=UPI001D257D9A|nr:HPr-rel-A system PqqD family peptide chaperone [Accumulibacter sp.]MCB1968025.1 HPr-rel-A system PqqD family peptide chaperone [Accumulibacter sp.]MCP5228505.1 HPr-rel-A system PqqD family peptide chaperone [Accumulibacter sp.]